MWAHIEQHGQCLRQCSGIARVFEDGQVFGDHYRYAMKFHKISDTEIEVIGVTQPPTMQEAHAIARAFRAAGLRVRRDRKSGARQGLRPIRI
jgi:hypothetical protein